MRKNTFEVSNHPDNMNRIDIYTERAANKIFEYPKFTLLFLTIVVAYYLYDSPHTNSVVVFFESLGYVGILLLGIFFAYGFTAAPATALFMQLAPDYNIFLAAAIGGLGAYFGDFMIYIFLKKNFNDEINKLKHERIIKQFSLKIPSKWHRVFLLSFAGLVISSPLPDELGVALLASSTSVSKRIFGIISYCFNSLGILVSLILGLLLA